MTTAEPGASDRYPTVPLETQIGASSTLRYARKFGIVFMLLAVAFGAASFFVLLGLTPIEPSLQIITSLLIVNGFSVTLLTYLVGREVHGLMQARRRGRAAARMHIRIVGLFGIVASIPAILVAIIAGITLDLGLDRIFEGRSRTIVDSSVSIAEAYVAEATTTLNVVTLQMAANLDKASIYYNVDRRGFVNFVEGQTKGLGLAASYVIKDSGQVVVEVKNAPNVVLPEIPNDLFTVASDGKPACIAPRTQSFAACVVKLRGLSRIDPDLYVYTIRQVNPDLINSIKLSEEIQQEFQSLEGGRVPLQIAFALLYVGICLTILLSAIWMGIAVADRLVEPIRRLIFAADEVKAGNLAITVPASRSEGELLSLTNTFNDMTSELRTQRDEILDNQEQTNRRRRFTEAVLSGVTAGVIGVSGEGRIAIANESGLSVLEGTALALVGTPLADASPELAKVIDNAETAGRSRYLEQITLMRGGRERTLNVQVSVDSGNRESHSHVITIDDITDLVSAQRTSAWADVARRIAHEIKNPLTPIQLSAERIRRRYGKKIGEDREVFDQCTDTIIRQVADIGRMVDEFSSFARMPKPTMQTGDLNEPVREAVFLRKVGHSDIDFDIQLGEEPLSATFDTRLLSQAFGNLIKNAAEAIEGAEFSEDERPRIVVRTESDADFHSIEIIDNGKGLPVENRHRLLEPYMTTREKGTGLGLAIVGKIIEEHGGTIELLDAPDVARGGRGAMVRVSLPIAQPVNKEEKPKATEEAANGV